MNKLGTLGEVPVGYVGDGGEVGVLGSRRLVRFHVLAGFFKRFFAPRAGGDEVRHATLGGEVHGNGGELGGRAALEEENLCVDRDG